MKNKKTLFILVPMVALVWGLIIWRVIDLSKDKDYEKSSYTWVQEEEEPADTSRYEPHLQYGDPFLRTGGRVTFKSGPEAPSKANRVKKVKITSIKGPSKPEGLHYKGIISCSGQTVGLLEMNGQKKLVRENSMIGSYEVVIVQKDSLSIRYQEKIFTYGIQ